MFLCAIFNGIDILYRAATDEEVTDFLNSDIIKTSDGFNAASVNIYNRKRITLLKDMYNNFDKNKKKELKKYIKEYDSELPFENNKFEIGNDQDLKKLMYGIDQRYYTTRINAEKRIANSVISLK